jgi:hypothetical protein
VSEKREQIAEFAPDAVMLDDKFDGAVLGTACVAGVDLVVYDEDAVIAVLALEMGEDGAREFYEFNILGAHVQNGPVFLSRLVGGDES